MGQFAIGTDDFIKFREKEAYFIDKSLFIKEVIDDTNEVLLITRPRRFGKTLNMSMLNYYLRYSKEDYTHFYSDLKIWDAGEKYKGYFQNTPTIFFTMKNVCCDNWELCYSMLVSMLAEVFSQYKYLKETIPEEEQNIFDNILNRKSENEDDFRYGLAYLSKWLYKYHKKKVYLIIDEYDTPIHEGYQNRYYTKIINFMQVFFGAVMKTNAYLDKAVLTGITRIAGESLFSKLNSFVSYNLTTEKFANYFGFTEEETQIAVERFAPFRNMEDIKKMYNGYLIGGISLYNPWSIMNVLDSTERMALKPYWYNTSSDALLRREFKEKPQGSKEELLDLVEGKVISKPIKDEVTYMDLETTDDSVWSFLLYSGYLTLKKLEINNDNTYDLCIPNEEVRGLMQNIVEKWFTEGIPTRDIQVFFDALFVGKVEAFKKHLTNMIRRSFSYFDITKTMPELVYHSYILGMLVFLKNNYYCESNPIVGEGRCDILICPKAGTYKDIAVILEFKQTDNKDKLEKVTDEALLQIRQQNYIEGAKKRGIKTIYCYGIGFYKAELMVKMEKDGDNDGA